MATEPNGRQATATRGAPDTRSASLAAPAGLRRLERLFGQCEWPERGVFLAARKRARRHALEALERSSGEREQQTALLAAAAELFRSLSGAPDGAELGAQISEELEQSFGLSTMDLAREVVRGPELLTMPPKAACRSILATLVSLAPLRNASLWILDGAERPACMCHVGDTRPSRGAQQLALQLLTNEQPDAGGRRQLLGVAVGNRRPASAALVGYTYGGGRERANALFVVAAPMAAALVERDALLAANAETERALLQASERRLTRLGFDLHDGPIQDVALLAEDLRLFRDQLERVLDPLSDHALVHGRIEDLDAQLASLDAELRRLSGEVQAASVPLDKPFRSALDDRVRAFTARTCIDPSVTVDGDTTELSSSQQIALLNIIQESLSNVREHANASKVQITVAVNRAGINASVTDDGRGFELEPTLVRAARQGSIGLIAINERVRLLGGQCRIESRPGGPTVVSVALQRWMPRQTAAGNDRLSA
jgi:signal transduction histidine kinase